MGTSNATLSHDNQIPIDRDALRSNIDRTDDLMTDMWNHIDSMICAIKIGKKWDFRLNDIIIKLAVYIRKIFVESAELSGRLDENRRGLMATDTENARLRERIIHWRCDWLRFRLANVIKSLNDSLIISPITR